MDVFEDRLESFTNWPHGFFLRTEVMAAAGRLSFIHYAILQNGQAEDRRSH